MPTDIAQVVAVVVTIVIVLIVILVATVRNPTDEGGELYMLGHLLAGAAGIPAPPEPLLRWLQQLLGL